MARLVRHIALIVQVVRFRDRALPIYALNKLCANPHSIPNTAVRCEASTAPAFAELAPNFPARRAASDPHIPSALSSIP